ncbi:LamG-like jellyroll fold domain-containing protein, partial [Flavobacterium sp.]|uniref:LamG-like jellyroll fold domain-containing protein n=1 Tax=Flavobacterium sp. TaxID=239 RepID=UPI0038FC6A1C
VADATLIDNCSGSTIAYTLSGATTKTLTSGQVGTYTFNKGITTINYTVTDAASNTTTGTKTITVNDTIAPSLTAGANQSANTDTGVCTASVMVSDATLIDNCSGSTIAYTLSGATTKTLTAGQVGTYTFNKGVTTINYTVTDAASNTTSGSKTITVIDNQTTSLTSGANQTATTNSGVCSASVIVSDATFIDNCTGSTIAYTLSGATIKTLTAGQVGTYTFNKGVTTINYTVTDATSNTTSGSKTITVTDITAPTLTAGANQSANTDTGVCTASVMVSDATFGDNCSGSTITYTLSGATTKTLTAGQVGTYTFNKGITTINYTVTDAASNTTSGSKTITVNDTIAPSLTAGSNQTNTTDAGVCTASVVVTDATFSDNCTVATIAYTLTGATTKTLSAGQVGTYTFNKGVTTINYTVTDAASNTTSGSKTITVTDITAPTLTAGANQSANTDTGVCTASVMVSDATFNDNCTGSTIAYTLSGATIKTLTSGQVGTYTFNKGVTTINYTVTDATSNTTSGSKTITVTDITAPTLTAGANQNVNTDTGVCTASVIVADATFGDNCTGSTIAYTLSGATTKTLTAGQVGTYTFNKGITTINYTVTDATSNTTSGSKTITVTDNQTPTITSLTNLSANCSITISTAPTSPDNCGTITGVTSDITLPFTYSKTGIYIIGWNFTDAAGNSKNISQTIIVTDTAAAVPNVTNLPNINFTGCQLLSSQITYPTANDTCDGTITGVPDIVFPINVTGTTNVTWTYTDKTGNVSTQTQKIIMTSETINGGVVKGYISVNGSVGTATNEVSITSCSVGGNVIKMNLSGQTGTIVQWEKFKVGNPIWTIISNTTNSYTVTFYAETTESTYYRALIRVGNCYQYSSSFYVRALPADLPPVLDQTLYNICLNQQITLMARKGYTVQEDAIAGKGGDFNVGQLNTQDPKSWLVDGSPGDFTAGGNSTKPRNWSGTNNQTFGSIGYDSQENKFTISSGNQTITTGNDKYTGANPTTLESPIFSLANMSSASVDFDQAYYFATGDTGIIYVSIDGGSTYSVLRSLHTPYQPILQWYTDPNVTAAQKVGATASQYNFKNDNTSIPLTAYLGNTNVRIKWTFRGTDNKSVWAMDGITIPVKPKLDIIEWTDGIGTPGIPALSQGQLETSYTFTPQSPGKHTYGSTVLVDGCRSYSESGTSIAQVNVDYAYAGSNITLTPDVCGTNTVQLNAYDNTKTAIQNAAKGSYTLPTNCTNCGDLGTNTLGTWTIIGSSTCGAGTLSNVNDPNAIFTGEVGSYVLNWKVGVCTSTINIVISACTQINFDGTNDYIDFKKTNYDLNGSFSIEAWIKTTASSANVQTIFSKRDANKVGIGDGYDLRVQNDYVTFIWNGTGIITSPNKINPNRWHHIAVTYANSEYKLYIDGILIISKSGATAPITNNNISFLGAMDQNNNASNTPVNYFNGWIDEFKIWNVALNEEQIHQMMNQEIKEQTTGNNVVYGEVIPMPIYGLLWSNLKGYYRMDQTSCGYLNPSFGLGANGKLKNITSSESQTAPLPYYSVRNGDWNNTTAASPWAYGNTVWNYPNSAGINGQFVNWNIVRSLHDINSTAQDIILLGLKVESGKITMANPSQTLNEDNNGQGLWITHYLKLDGFVDLVGKSQLLQKKYNAAQIGESILDATSSGYIERDQKGQKNHFNYNYWSSPVSPINSTTNNTNYSVSGVMKDGTTSTPRNINWIGGLNGAPTTPISLARRWLYKFDNYSNAYANWVQISENDAIRVGQGYIFKGTGTTTTNQNYTFKGKPNNGTIATNSVSSDQLLLTGNPYPSALNANKFISDNINSIDGTLYFWEHYSTNDTHILRDYQGGYATRNLTGGIAPVAPALISGRGSSSKIPNQFIPVGQSFFVNGKIGSGGTITYNNEQRGFYKENESGISNTLFKTTDSTKKLNSPIQNKIEVDSEEIDTYMRIRLGFNSNNNYHRQLLLGFMNEKATSGIDIGYDALNFDNYPNDMYFLNGENQLVIQGEGFFDVDSIYTLGVKTAVEGPVSFIIDAVENFDQDQEIYIYDKLNDSYHDIRYEKFEVNLPAGTNHTRFSLRFINSKALSNDDNMLETDAIQIKHIKEENRLVINNNMLDLTVEKVIIYNLLGQNIASMKVENQDQKNIQLPIKSISAGVYIAKIKTSNGSISKKFIVN